MIPNCEKCGNVMKHRRENVFDLGYFVCSNNHKRLSITVEELNSLVKETLLEHIHSISTKHLRSIISKRHSKTFSDCLNCLLIKLKFMKHMYMWNYSFHHMEKRIRSHDKTKRCRVFTIFRSKTGR